jgi:hypothetical protein
MNKIIGWDLLNEDLKNPVNNAAQVVNNLPLGLIKHMFDGKLPDNYWDEDYFLAFHIYHAIFVFNSFSDVSLLSLEQKGLALQSIISKICPEEAEKTINRFKLLAKSPTSESQRGHDLSMKYCSIVMQKHEVEYPNDTDIIKIEQEAEKVQKKLDFIFEGKNKTGLSNAFLKFYVYEYAMQKFLGLSKEEAAKKMAELPMPELDLVK